MIDAVEIQGFKCFDQAAFRLRRLNVLVGGNAAGKSTLLQSLLLLRQSCDLDGQIREIRLSGELYAGGTAKDTVRRDADRNLRILVSGEKRATVVQASYQSGTNPRVLQIKDATTALGALADHSGSRFAYLAAERTGPRVTYPLLTATSPLAGMVGKHGETTTAYLSYCKNGNIKLPEPWRAALDSLARFASFDSADTSSYRVANVLLGWVIPGASFDAFEVEDSDNSRLTFNNYKRDPNANVRPTNIGFGLTQVLPVIAGAIALEDAGLYLLETPEAHLHPLGQSRIGAVLALAASASSQIVVETHSDHVVNGIRLAVKRKWIRSDDVTFLYFTKQPNENRSSIEVLTLDADGRLSDWPPGFFDQIEKDLAEL